MVLINSLIEGSDYSEIIRDEIAAILLTELKNQQQLAETAEEDPNLWKLRIFVERSNPWDVFPDGEDEVHAFVPPIVCVSLDGVTYDPSRSNSVAKQHATATYNLDCIGYGRSAATEDGHISGDQMAATEAHRAARLVRRILMAGPYTYLGMRGIVGRRWIQQLQVFQPHIDNRQVEHVLGVRLSFQVEFNESSPQVTGQPIELVSTSVYRAETGELFFSADYPAS